MLQLPETKHVRELLPIEMLWQLVKAQVLVETPIAMLLQPVQLPIPEHVPM
jgi:hypothetical protein